MEWTPAGLTIGGEPLRFYHFAGFDPYRPAQLTKHAVVASWQRLAEHPGVAYLLALRAQRADLRVAVPDVPGGSETAFLEWVERDLAGQDESWALVRG